MLVMANAKVLNTTDDSALLRLVNQFKHEIIGYVDNKIVQTNNQTFHYKGFISAEEPTVDVRAGLYWYANSFPENTPPDTNFTWNVKEYSNASWSKDVEYLPDILDMWYNVATKEVWFYLGTQWEKTDFTVDFDTTFFEQNRQLVTLKNNSITDTQIADNAAIAITKIKDLQNTLRKKVNTTDVISVAQGGTGANTVEQALVNLGLDQVDNTADMDKPISIATQNALGLKADLATVNNLSSTVSNKADASALSNYLPLAGGTVTGRLAVNGTTTFNNGSAISGDVTLADSSKIRFLKSLDLPIPYINTTESIGTNSRTLNIVAGDASIELNTANNTNGNITITHSNGLGINTTPNPSYSVAVEGDAYVSGNLFLKTGIIDTNNSNELTYTVDGVTKAIAYKNDVTVNSVAGKTGNVVLSKSDVGLSNVDNTSDTNKPISNAVQTALNSKANNSTVTALQSTVNSKANSSDLAKYLPLTGGTLTGNLTAQSLTTKRANNAVVALTSAEDNKSTGYIQYYYNNGTPYLQLLNYAYNPDTGTNSNRGQIIIQDSSLHITSMGKGTGINTAPDSNYTLKVGGKTLITDMLEVTKQIKANGGISSSGMTYVGDNARVQFWRETDGWIPTIRASAVGNSNTNRQLTISIPSSCGITLTAEEKNIAISADGGVGIGGTPDATQSLKVYGDTTVTGDLAVNGDISGKYAAYYSNDFFTIHNITTPITTYDLATNFYGRTFIIHGLTAFDKISDFPVNGTLIFTCGVNEWTIHCLALGNNKLNIYSYDTAGAATTWQPLVSRNDNNRLALPDVVLTGDLTGTTATFSNTITASTPVPTSNDNTLATTEWVKTKIDAIPIVSENSITINGGTLFSDGVNGDLYFTNGKTGTTQRITTLNNNISPDPHPIKYEYQDNKTLNKEFAIPIGYKKLLYHIATDDPNEIGKISVTLTAGDSSILENATVMSGEFNGNEDLAGNEASGTVIVQCSEEVNFTVTITLENPY